MGLDEYARVVRSGWRTVVVVMGILVVGAFALSLATTTTYVAKADVFLSPQVDDSAQDLAAGFSYAQSQVRSFAQLALTPLVLDPAIDELGSSTTASALAKQVSISARRDAVLLTVIVKQPSPSGAARTADAVATSLAEAVERVSPTTTAAQHAVRAEVVGAARTPTFPSSPRTKLNVAVALLLGAGAGMLLEVWRDARKWPPRPAGQRRRVRTRPPATLVERRRTSTTSG